MPLTHYDEKGSSRFQQIRFMVWLRVPTQKKVSGDYMLPSEDQKRSRLQYASLMHKMLNTMQTQSIWPKGYSMSCFRGP